MEFNGAPVLTFEAMRDDMRAIYTGDISRALDECFEQLILPADKAALALDAAMFTVFLMVVKTVEAKGLPLTKANMLAAYWPIEKHIKKELPGMVLEFGRAAESGGKE